MDPNAAITVSLGTLGTSFVGALGGSSYAFFRSQPPSLMGFASGVNSGIAGLTFFALREYAITPALLLSLDTPEHTRRRIELGIATPPSFTSTPSTLTPRTIREYKLVDTAVSGAIAGAGLNFWRRGVRGVVPGATTAALVCTFLQYAVNELSVQRIRYVAVTPAPVLVMPPAQLAVRPEATVVPLASQPPTSLSEKIVNTISYVIPLTRLDDKEYLERLEQKLDVLDSKIDRLQQELLSSPRPR